MHTRLPAPFLLAVLSPWRLRLAWSCTFPFELSRSIFDLFSLASCFRPLFGSFLHPFDNHWIEEKSDHLYFLGSRVDNSEYTRNGDFAPSRFQSQLDAVSVLSRNTTGANAESCVGIVDSSGPTYVKPPFNRRKWEIRKLTFSTLFTLQLPHVSGYWCGLGKALGFSSPYWHQGADQTGFSRQCCYGTYNACFARFPALSLLSASLTLHFCF